MKSPKCPPHPDVIGNVTGSSIFAPCLKTCDVWWCDVPSDASPPQCAPGTASAPGLGHGEKVSAATAHRGSPGRIAQRALLPAARAHSGCELPIPPASFAPFGVPERNPGLRGALRRRRRGGCSDGRCWERRYPHCPGPPRTASAGGSAWVAAAQSGASAPAERRRRGAVRCGAARSGAEHVGAEEEAGR